MAQEENPEQQEQQDEEQEEQKEYSGEKIMCFVSKQMAPIEDTVELEVQEHKKVRVLPKYIKFDPAEEGLDLGMEG